MVVWAAFGRYAASLATTRSVLPWGHRRSTAIGLSCLCFCAPVVIDASVRWPLQAGVSVMSDYFMSGLPSGWHLVDRWLATLNIVAEIYRALRVLPALQVAVLAGTPLACKLWGAQSAARGDYAAYRLSHVLWHLLASAAAVYVEAAHWAASSAL